MRVEFSAIDERLRSHDLSFRRFNERFDALEKQTQEGDEETRRFMRVLHEELLARISLLDEGRRRRKQ